MAEYNKAGLQAAGGTITALIYALMDGVGLDDLDEAKDVGVALFPLIDEIKDDPDAALLDIVSGLTSSFADRRRSDQWEEVAE